MTNLISAKEALIALGSGKEVEYKSIDGKVIHTYEKYVEVEAIS